MMMKAFSLVGATMAINSPSTQASTIQPRAMKRDLPYCVLLSTCTRFHFLLTMAWKISTCPSVATVSALFPSILKSFKRARQYCFSFSVMLIPLLEPSLGLYGRDTGSRSTYPSAVDLSLHHESVQSWSLTLSVAYDHTEDIDNPQVYSSLVYPQPLYLHS